MLVSKKKIKKKNKDGGAHIKKEKKMEGSLAHIKGEEERATNEFVRGKPL